MNQAKRRAFVVGAHVPNGGTRMAYHLGRILQRNFGFEAIAVAVGDETSIHGIVEYDCAMTQVPIAEMEQRITPDDVLIVNPSFSDRWFGWRLPGTKICYVQGFNTYPLLDVRLDHFVAVSGFVAEYLRTVYAIDAPVIPAFVDRESLPGVAEWSQRPANVVTPYCKGASSFWDVAFAAVQSRIALRAPHIQFDPLVGGEAMPQSQLFKRIGASRFLLSLSAAEGFGLVPLEAMALGCVVTGFDGFGGREYFEPLKNCAVAPYPDIDLVVDRLIAIVGDTERAQCMSNAAKATAAQFGYARFKAAWIAQFSRMLKISPMHPAS